MLNILYLNCNHAQGATLNATITAARKNADILCITEPYYPPGCTTLKAQGWDTICSPRAAILVRKDIKHIPRTTTHEDITATMVGEIIVICLYASPNEDIVNILNPLYAYLLNHHNSPCIILGDFNCQTQLIPGYRTTARGQVFEDLLNEATLALANNTQPTWRRGKYTSINDYVCYRGTTPPNFQVLNDESMSDHSFISVQIDTAYEHMEKRFKTNTSDLSIAIRNLEIATPALRNNKDIDGFIANITTMLQTCIKNCSTEIAVRKKKPYFWKPELETLKKTLQTLTRRINRCQHIEVLLIYLHTRKILRSTYRKIIMESKYAAFRELCTQSRPWGTPYKIAKYTPNKPIPLLKSVTGTHCTTNTESIKLLLKEKFPTSTQTLERDKHTGVPTPSPEVTAEEIAEIIKKLPNNKAPGPDKLCTHTIKALNRHHKEVLPKLFTSCLTLGYYPQSWRDGRVAFIHKPGKDPTLTDSYRPLTMLSILGKIYERVINWRIVEHFDTYHPLHQRQFGFRKNIGTEQAILQVVNLFTEECLHHRLVAALSIDIKGAFDHIEWNGIIEELAAAHIPHYLLRSVSSYLSNRTAHCDGQSTQLERGCPQGSVLAPTLWNILYDVVIKRIYSNISTNVCVYADDTIIIVSADDKEALETRIQQSMASLATELEKIGLLLNIRKTEILLRNRLPLYLRGNDEELKIVISNHTISTKKSIKYLGMMVDHKLSFKEHVRYIEEKMTKRIPLLQNLARNLYGYGYHARKIMFQGLVFSIAKYCSSIWYHKLKLKTYRNSINKIQRRCDIITSRSYRDVSFDVATILAASTPAHLQIVERSVRWLLSKNLPVPYWGHLPRIETDANGNHTMEGRPITHSEAVKAFKTATLREWEKMWAAIAPKKWPQLLLPTIRDRLAIKTPPNFWTSQAISNHGCLRSYLHRIKRTESSDCPCGFGIETAEHVLTECPRFVSGRPLTWDKLEEYHLPYMKDVMMKLWKMENPNFRLKTTCSDT